MRVLFQTQFTIILIVMLSACGTTPKSEMDHYDDLRKGTIYKTYQKISIEAMKPIVREYDKELAKDNKPQVGKTHVHALLGLIWIASAEPKYALAETEYAVAQANFPRDRYAALTLQALAMHQQGWPYLGKQKTAEARTLVAVHGLSNRYGNILVLVHVAGSTLALQEGNIPFVANEIRELGVATKQSWILELGHVTEEAYSGSHAKAMAKVEQLKNDPNLTAQQQAGVDKVMRALNAGGKDVGIAVAKAVVSVGMDYAIQSSPLTPLVVGELPEKYRTKLVKYL